ncbi:MAG: hypothetical protein GY838_02115 [bacterium]|nr:hypothetical protein [bacterium]
MIRHSVLRLFLFMAAIAMVQDSAAQDPPSRIVSEKYDPAYLSVLDLADLLGAQWTDGRLRVQWQDGSAHNTVDLRAHETANFVIATGSQANVDHILGLARELDLPPQQIEIEAMIIEMDNQRAHDLGLDWDHLLERSSAIFDLSRRDDYNSYRESTEQTTNGSTNSSSLSRGRDGWDENKRWSIRSAPTLSEFIGIIQETGSGKVRYTPKVLTLNNRKGTLLDGQRTTFVTRVSAASNTYETQSMDAGLKLSVIPSLGQAGYMTLHVIAELTQLAPDLDFSGSPVKNGQILENTIVVSDGQPVVLGGFQRVEKREGTKRIPILGHILPFLFSREYRTESSFDSIVVLTARVVGLDARLDESTMEILADPSVPDPPVSEPVEPSPR